VAHQQDPTGAHLDFELGMACSARRDHFEAAIPKRGLSLGQPFAIKTERENNVAIHVRRSDGAAFVFVGWKGTYLDMLV
jgi:hypothetical protein